MLLMTNNNLGEYHDGERSSILRLTIPLTVPVVSGPACYVYSSVGNKKFNSKAALGRLSLFRFQALFFER
jgi:hypothetical protein